MIKSITKIHESLFSKKNIKSLETVILYLAVIGFIAHLVLIYLNKSYDLEFLKGVENLLTNPISALYTPFSFILLYEVFLLVYYLPRSFTTSIAKEYEIISLIMIRKIFEDIPNLNTDSGIFNQGSLYLLYNLLGILFIYYLIFLFKKIRKKIPKRKLETDISRFIAYKKSMSIALVPILIILCIYNLYDWLHSALINQNITENLSSVFFVDFFTILILVDVFILLISFGYTDRYAQIIRNTGFIISTILLRLSFSVSDLSSVILLISGVLFGLVILKIYQLTETNIVSK
tara:strand:+ start:470 stop:1339 length:870 start_codon:yes stop_codon:yes gene_type:complete